MPSLKRQEEVCKLRSSLKVRVWVGGVGWGWFVTQELGATWGLRHVFQDRELDVPWLKVAR